MSARRRALEALIDITGKGAYANLRLKEAESGLDRRDAAFVSALVYGTLDRLLYIDRVIEMHVQGRVKPVIRNILRLGACQALFMDVPHSAACDESVKLAKEIGKGALSGYVNAVMRSICRNAGDPLPMPEDVIERTALRASCPPWLAREYVSRFGEEFTVAMLTAKPSGMTVRAQYPISSDELAEYLSDNAMRFSRGSIDENAFLLERGMDASQDEWFAAGKMTVQSESAMLVCRALGDMRNKRVLDACSAPGGKTAYIWSLSHGTADITALELHEHRTELIRRTLSRLGVNADVRTADASSDMPEFHGTFDGVLADVPCSGLGVPGKPDARYAKSPEIISGLAALQCEILAACCKYVKPGGVLVYSTCTVSKAENEDNAAAFLAEHDDFAPADADWLPDVLKDRVINGGIQLFPNTDGTEGFYIAKFIRRGD